MWNLEKWYRWTYLQSKSRVTDVRKKRMITKMGREGFPDSSVGKESTCSAEDPVSIPGLGRSAEEGISSPLQYSGLLLWLSWWRICLQCGRSGFDPWVGVIPWRRERLPTPVLWPGEFHGIPWNLSPGGLKEWDTIEWLFHFHFSK